MRVLVTGANSFIGSFLCEALAARGDAITSIVRSVADVRDGPAVTAIVAASSPELVFHLAAQSNGKRSLADPIETLDTNVKGTLNVLEALRVHAPAARVISMGSSAEYGESGRTHPLLAESAPLLPTTPYGVSKTAQGQLARIYVKAHGMHVIHVRPFSVIGPRKRSDALSDFCANVAAIERGAAPRLFVGNTTGVRDFVDVRDAVAALVLLADKGTSGETYNLCHGVETPLLRLIEILGKASKVPFTTEQDPSRLRVADDLRLIGDPSKLRALGYEPKHALADTVAVTLEHWRAQSPA